MKRIDKNFVEKLLKKHFGAPRPCLTLDAASSRGSRTYFYTLENEAAVKRIRALLGAGYEGESIPRLSYDLSNENGKRYPLCASLREEYGYWKAEFSRIKSVSFHSTYGKRAAATLVPSDHATARLSSGGRGRYITKRKEDGTSDVFRIPEDDQYRFYGFWGAERDGESRGVPYWINVALSREPRFRAFAVDFFLEGAKEHPILRDVAKTVAETGFFLPEVTFSELIKHETAKSLIESFSESFPSCVKVVNASDINAGYLTALLAPHVDARDLHLLMKLTAADVPRLVHWYDLHGGIDAVDVVYSYYNEKYGDILAATAAHEYAAECLAKNTPVKLSLSLKTLLEMYHALYE